MNICSQGRKLLNFLTFKLIIIQFIICVSFSGFSMLTKVIPTARFHRTTTWTKTMTRNDATTQFTPTTHQTMHQQRIPIPQQGTIQHHTKPCIQQHDQQHTEQSTYQTTYQRAYEQHTIHHTIQQTKDHTTINQWWAYPMIYQKTFQTYQTIWQTEQLANHTTINHLGLRKVVAISKKVATMQSLESLLFSYIFSFFALAAFECMTRANFWFTGE